MRSSSPLTPVYLMQVVFEHLLRKLCEIGTIRLPVQVFVRSHKEDSVLEITDPGIFAANAIAMHYQNQRFL